MEEQKFIEVYTETNPNPNSLKFVLNFNILMNGNVDFENKESAANSPLAVALFEEFSFIQRVFIASNFITLTKDEPTDWFEVRNGIRAFIKDWFEKEKVVFTEEIVQDAQTTEAAQEETETEAKIKAVLEDYIRPAVEQDGGAITFHSFDDGIVKVLLQGACSGCPSSTITLKAGIENLLQRMVPEVKEVVAEGV